jgi:uncharacterized protein YcnI
MSIRRLLLVPLFAVLGLLALALPAQAKVTIVPGAGKAGETATFAFRVANQSTVPSTRVELVFPQDKPITFAEVDPVRGWNATINPRSLPAPIQVGDKTVNQVVGSIVLDGGSVGPGQFEQFLITLGPLPADGPLSFDVTQGYSDGRVERWTGADAPSIAIGAGNAVPGAPVVAGGNDNSIDSDAGAAEDSEGGFPALALLWGALGLGVVIVAVVGIRARLRTRRPATAAAEEAPQREDPEQKEETVEVAGR